LTIIFFSDKISPMNNKFERTSRKLKVSES